MRIHRLPSAYLLLCASVPLWFVPSLSAAEPTYWQDVRPVLRKHCTVCHSAKHLKDVDVSGGLALDTPEAIRRGSKHPVLQPGKSADSLLVQLLLSTDENKRMPQSAPPLPPETIALVRRWIDGGAVEGQKPVETATTSVSSAPRRTRKLDVTLPTEAIPPKGILGSANPAKLELTLPVGPLAPITAVAFSPDGKLLASGCYGQATIWDLNTTKPIKVLTNVLGAVHDLRFSPDGKWLLVAGGQPSAKGDLRIFQVADWKLLATLGGHEDVVFGTAFSTDGKLLASASFDKTVRIWDMASFKTLHILSGHSDFVYAVAFDPKSQWLVSCSKDRSVKKVEVATGKSLFTYSGMNEEVLAVAVSPDGKRIVSSGVESNLYWWDPQNGARIQVGAGHGAAVHELCFSKDGKLLASAGGDRLVRLWNGSSGALLSSFSVGSLVYAVALSGDGKRMASGSFDGLVRLWDVPATRQLTTFLSLPAEGDKHEWLAVTPEGYACSSSGMAALGRWTMAGQAVAADVVWKTLRQPEVVAKAVRGDKLPLPTFGK